MYYIKTPFLIKKLFPTFVWAIPDAEKALFLTFDDGPTPGVTNWVLNELKKYDASATFFMTGKNAEAHPNIFNQVMNAGHALGNHTFDHLNGWKTKDSIYLNNIMKADRSIPFPLFRPPYGKIKKSQARKLRDRRIIMWDILTGDFDHKLNKKKALRKIKNNTTAGSIILMHDSKKAAYNLKYLLPRILEHFSTKGFVFKKINKESTGDDN